MHLNTKFNSVCWLLNWWALKASYLPFFNASSFKCKETTLLPQNYNSVITYFTKTTITTRITICLSKLIRPRSDICVQCTSKECVTRFSTSSFFHDSNPSGPLLNRLKMFEFDFVEIFEHKLVSAVCKSKYFSSNLFFHDKCVHS